MQENHIYSGSFRVGCLRQRELDFHKVTQDRRSGGRKGGGGGGHERVRKKENSESSQLYYHVRFVKS